MAHQSIHLSIFLNVIIVFALIPKAVCQNNDEDFSVYNATTNSDGECICHIAAPTVIHCTTIEDSVGDNMQLITLQEQVTELAIKVSQQVTASQTQSAQITELSSTMLVTLEKLGEIASGHIVITRPEYDILRQEIADMESLLIILELNSTVSSSTTIALKAEIDNITAVLNQLEQSESADTSQLMADVNDLKQRLIDCQQEAVEDLFQPWNEIGDQDTCGTLVDISDPYTVSGIGPAKGVWFRDPTMNPGKVYSYLLSNSRYFNYIDSYQSVTSFHNAEVTQRIQLPENSQGLGIVAYNGSFYYNVYNTRNIARYNILLSQVTKISLPSDVYFNNQAPYFSSTYSDIDFAVDEFGLWVIYSSTSAGGLIVLSKVDPVSLALTQTWTTSFRKQSTANCFVICQVLYCTNGYNSHDDKINYFFDTKTGTESFVYVSIDSKFGATYSLDYNPYDQKLYAWDNSHQVVYDMAFGDQESG